MHNLQGEKKFHLPENCPTPPPPTSKINSSSFYSTTYAQQPCFESSRNVICHRQETPHNDTCKKEYVTHRINPFQISLVHSLLAFALEADVIEVHLVRANQIPGRNLIVVTDVKIHLLIVHFFF